MLNAANDNDEHPRRHNPFDREVRSGRINGDLLLVANMFERDYRRAVYPTGGTSSPRKKAPDALIGAEASADAFLVCRFIAGRLGHLYPVLVDGIILGAKMAELAGVDFAGQSTADAPARGRSRLIDALRLTSSAYDEWLAMLDGVVPRMDFALGLITPHATPRQREAANDNFRRIGNAVHRHGVDRSFFPNPRLARVAARSISGRG